MSINVGNAGEHLIMAELLARGYHAFMADRGNPAFDAAAILPDGRQVKIRVKTCSTNRTFQYNAKRDGTIFLDYDPSDPTDFCALVAPTDKKEFEFGRPTSGSCPPASCCATCERPMTSTSPRRNGTAPRESGAIRSGSRSG